jgi:NAD(P)-dependent dehydrogenase (short-subunit alcohol dehydrogenase family)
MTLPPCCYPIAGTRAVLHSPFPAIYARRRVWPQRAKSVAGTGGRLLFFGHSPCASGRTGEAANGVLERVASVSDASQSTTFGGFGELSGRVALVTGASSGIGRAVAINLVSRGARVMGVARDVDRLAAVAAELDGFQPLAVSLGTPDGGAYAVEEARRQLGPPTILVHAAGLGGYLCRPIFEERRELWETMLAVNLTAAFELIRCASSDMRACRWGRIVLIGSTAGSVGAPAMAAYSASKAGLLGLVRSVAHDLGAFGVTCNAVVPGWVRDTRMAEQDAEQEAASRSLSVDDVWAEREDANPSGRVVTAEEVANVVGFLTSPASSGISGDAITVALGSVW